VAERYVLSSPSHSNNHSKLRGALLLGVERGGKKKNKSEIGGYQNPGARRPSFHASGPYRRITRKDLLGRGTKKVIRGGGGGERGVVREREELKFHRRKRQANERDLDLTTALEREMRPARKISTIGREGPLKELGLSDRHSGGRGRKQAVKVSDEERRRS